MKTIKKYLMGLPKVVKTIIGLNILVYIVSCISAYIFSFDINYYLGFHPTHSSEFKFYQLFTFMFTHSYDPTHITLNVILLLFFSVSFAKKFGVRNYILMYVLSSVFCILFFNLLKNKEFEHAKKELIFRNIDFKSLDYHSIYDNPKETGLLIEQYLESKKYGVGASGALFGFIGSFVFLNLRLRNKPKTILVLILGFYLIYFTINCLFTHNYSTSGTAIGHIGGLCGGIIVTLAINNKKGILKSLFCYF